ncbi:MAG: hypothetical protein GF307_07680 [candidate division Zixibacteria bacterium]|nr:hypothetical protein [candidate division Zixibacteria bacterium]
MHPKADASGAKKGNKPRKLGVLLSSFGGDFSPDIWELLFLYYFVEKSRFRIVNIIAPDLDSGRSITKIQDIPGLIMGTYEPMDREIGKDISALIIPGVISIDKKASQEEKVALNQELKRFIRDIYRRKKPIAASGFSVKYLTQAINDLTESPPSVTVGNDPRFDKFLERMGVISVNTRNSEVIIDETNELVTTAGHYGEEKIGSVNKAMENMVSGLLSLIDK